MNENLSLLWEEVKKTYTTQYPDDNCENLLRNSKAINFNDDKLTVIVANQMMRKLLLNRSAQLSAILSQQCGKPTTIDVIALEAEENADQEIPVIEKNTSTIKDTVIDSHLDSRFTFKNFVVGNNTRFTHAAAQRVVENPGKIYNPLFVYGKPGLGKTHIIQAIGNAMKTKNPYANVLYITTEEFTNDLITAISKKTTENFHNKYRNLDCLIIDDIQQLKGKERTQEEFFNTFNALEQSHKQIIIASDRSPQEIETLQDRITSRMSKGFLGDIQEPDLETRLAILKAKAEERNLELNNECMNLIAQSITSNIRIMESICNKLALLNEMGEKITQDVISKEINKFGEKVKSDQITFANIMEVVTDYFGVTEEDLIGKKRNAEINKPRQIIMYLAKTVSNLTFKEIGNELGGRDHSTVMNGYDKIDKLVKAQDKMILSTIENIMSNLK